MTRAAWGQRLEDILACLNEHGPLPAVEIAKLVGAPEPEVVSKICRRACTVPLDGETKLRMHIHAWQREGGPGVRRYIRPVYRAGHGVNVPKPAAGDRNEQRNETMRAHLRRMRMSSVFRLGAFGAAVLRGEA